MSDDFMRREIERAIRDAEHPAGMSVHDGKARVSADLLRRLLTENEALKQTLHDELDGNLRLRELGGALPTEPMTTFLERVFAENKALRAQRDALLEALRRFADTDLTNPIVRDTFGFDVLHARAAIDAARSKT